MISDKMVEAAFRSEMPDALSRVISRRHIRALLTAALSAASCNCPGEGRPAASGAHPDALPDGTLSKSTAKRLAAASVSERARALMAQAYRDGGFPHAAGTLEAGVIDSVDSCALRALEQALTQQRACATCGGRGEIGGHVGQTAETFDYVTEPCPECTTPQPSASVMEPGALHALVTAANAVLAENPADDGMWTLEQAVRPFNAPMPAECANGCPTNQACDYCQYAPQPSADAVRELVKRWRELSVKSHRDGQYQGYDTLRLCADELESLLSAASGEKGVGNG